MHTSNHMSLGRVWQLLKIDIFLYSKSFISVFLLFAGIVLITSVSHTAQGDIADTVGSYYKLFLFTGIIMVNAVLSKLHKPLIDAHYLLLPASPAEKYMSKLMLTSFIFIIISLLFSVVVSFIAWGINYHMFSISTPIFNPFQTEIIKVIRTFLFAHSLYFFGSIYFRRTALLKTSLSIMSFTIIFSVFIGLGIWLLYGDFLQGLQGNYTLNLSYLKFFGMYNEFTRGVIWPTIRSGFFFGATFFFWILGYIRLKELEVM